MRLVRHLWEAALNLVYPPSCFGCGRPTTRPQFCRSCAAAIEPPRSPLCVTCGVPFQTSDDADHPCSRCLQAPPRFGRARACTIYDGSDAVVHPLKSVLQRYKYNRDVGLAKPLAQLVHERCPLRLADYDVLMPVPLHLTRLRWRGFNQAQLLLGTLAPASGRPVDAMSLQRLRPTRPQVELNEAERRRNVAGAFHVTTPEHVRGRRILLFDDVYTTGATVNDCSRALLRAGARSIDVLVLARAVVR